MKTKMSFSLRFIISILVILTVLLTAIVGVFAAIKVNKDSLIKTYLDNNYQYSKKIAYSTNELIKSMEKNVATLAKLTENFPLNDTQKIIDDMSDVYSRYFNSVFIADKERKIQAITSSTVGLSVGDQLESEVSYQAVKLQKPLISQPYMGKTNRLIILISSPIFDQAGAYQGFVGGTIYLQAENVLSNMLGEHFFGNGSYVYVVDTSKKLIFHPDPKRIGEVVQNNEVIENIRLGKSGSMKVKNSKGKYFYAGYTYEAASGWGIVSQTPISVIDKPIHDLIVRMIMQSIPFLLIILALAWILAFYISNPLYKLAKFTDESIHHFGKENPLPKINTKIYEVRQLYHSTEIAMEHLASHLHQLNTEAKTDGLTGLWNRRSFNYFLDEWIEYRESFSLILFDIDFFKKVNDVYGHLVGDKVLKFMASKMTQFFNHGEECFRYGGEEFAILVPSADLDYVFRIAEQFRNHIQNSANPLDEEITVSLGIVVYPQHANHVDQLIDYADRALYRSKANGRNRVTIYQSE